jgi:hypothetical protein
MSEIDWNEQVQVQMLVPVSRGEHHVTEGGVIWWDGISLEDAVTRCMALPLEERNGATILAPSGHYDAAQIEALSNHLP